MPSKKRDKKRVTDLKAKTIGRKEALKAESVRGGFGTRTAGVRYKVDLHGPR